MACFAGCFSQLSFFVSPRAQPVLQVGEYKLGKSLGSGAFAEVKLATNNVSRMKVAVKIMPNGKMLAGAGGFQREVEIQRRLDHPHVVKVFDVVQTMDTSYIFMELASSGDLLEYLIGHSEFDENEARRLFQQLVAGLEHCHIRGVVHRDLKAENILLDKGGNVKIADFGFATDITSGELLTQCCGSPNYVAPELLFGNAKYKGPEVDVWSLGVVLYVMLCSRFPFDASSDWQIFAKVKRGRYSVPGYVTSDARHLLSRMLKVSPDERISIANIREHPWFQKNLPSALQKIDVMKGKVSPHLRHDSPSITNSQILLPCQFAKTRGVFGQHLGTVFDMLVRHLEF